MDLGNLSSEMAGNGLASRDLPIYQLSYVLSGLEVGLKWEFCRFQIMPTFVITIHDFFFLNKISFIELHSCRLPNIPTHSIPMNSAASATSQ